MTAKVSSLYSKIAEVSKAVGSLTTDKRNLQQKYDYISADKILDRVGSEMAKVGLVILPALVAEATERIEYQTGKWRYDCRLDMEMRIFDGDGNGDTVAWYGRGADYSVPDKAMYKAITSGHKYFLMKLFNVGAGNEDGEHEVQQPAKNDAKQFSQPEPMITEKQRRQLHAVGTQLYADEWDGKRGEMSDAFGVKSSNEWTAHNTARVIEGMNGKLADGAENVKLFESK